MSDEKETLMSFDAAMKVGDRAFAEVVVDHDGNLAFPTASGGVARTPWSPEYTGIRVRDIVRAPVPREVVTMQYEVLRDDEKTQPGDIVEYRDGSTYTVKEGDMPWRRGSADARIIARVLRPIKKP